MDDVKEMRMECAKKKRRERNLDWQTRKNRVGC